MHVVLASHYRLPVRRYGGTERVVVALARGLAAQGHRVTLLAAPGTRLDEATVVEVPAETLTSAATDLGALVPEDADILHTHFPLPRPPSVPCVWTVHGEMRPGAPVPPYAIFLSHNHARRHGSETFVYNGLDPADFLYRDDKDDYDLFLGRLHRVKGYRWAIEGARRAGHRLLLVGGWRPTFRPGIKFLGKVDQEKKVALLAGARCLWMPALWDEQFGLTTIEALFSGTPVLTTYRGSLPELVTPEVGALCGTLDEMVRAAETIHTRSSAACREHATRYFSHLAMAAAYVRMYRALLDTGALVAGQPTPYYSAQAHVQ
jgi:glycosyltransferase involved in cell wall biosynthesis